MIKRSPKSKKKAASTHGKNSNLTIADYQRLIRKIRNAVADYMNSEGCTCCEDVDQHKKDTEQLAKLLKVKKYKDNSGYDFGPYSTRFYLKKKNKKLVN